MHEYDFLNFTDYTYFQVTLNLIASTLWVIAYLIIVANARKQKFIEMPMAAAMGNIAWEFLWSFHFRINMGELLIWGIRAWLFLDLFIVALIFRYGTKQVLNPDARKYFHWMMPGLFIIWGTFFYAFTSQGLDTHMGAHSALILNVVMSSLYLVQGLRKDTAQYHSIPSGIAKGLGTAFFVFFVYVATPTDYTSMVLGASTFVLDTLYVIAVLSVRKQLSQSAQATA